MSEQSSLSSAPQRLLSIFAVLILGAASAPANEIQDLGSLEVGQIIFDGAPVAEAIEFLRTKSAELDPRGKGINFVLSPKVDPNIPVALRLRQVPLSVVTDYLAEVAGLEYHVDRHAVQFLPRNPETHQAPAGSDPAMAARVRRMHMAKVSFADAPIEDVAEFLASRSIQIDDDNRGINIVLGPSVDPGTPITLELLDLPLSSVLGYITTQADVKVRADPWAIFFYRPAPTIASDSLKETKTKTPSSSPRPPPNSNSSTFGIAGLDKPPNDPRSPAHPDYIDSSHAVVPERTNALGNRYQWINGKWTYSGKDYVKKDGKWVPVDDRATLEPAKGLTPAP